ncbi:glycosyltransferase family 4 protein [uncultured Sphingobacterium sp.]|uniref:glycosyltransferase family 4 protein n=1 Tax=uncultured Sphingobacterium sp. TaxID=182688 RepID=UPI00374A63E2
MNVIYDNIVYNLQKIGGISIYWYELTRRLLEEKGVDLKFIETEMGSKNICRDQLDLSKNAVTILKRIHLQSERFRSVPLDLVLSDFLDHTIFHSSYFRFPSRKDRKHVKTITTVHDFTHDYFFGGARVYLHNRLKNKAIEYSDAIICVSEHTKEDLLKFHPSIEPTKVHVIYNGVSDDFSILPSANHSPTDRYLLFVGSRAKYKNFDYALKLVKECTDLSLYIVGSPFTKKEAEILNKHLKPDRYKLFVNVSNSVLNELYNNAFAFIYPSSYEGFGIPLLEAMRAGCVPISLNSSSIPEVMGRAGILLNTLDIDEGLAALKTVEQNKQDLQKKGLERASHFSWDTTFNNTLTLYNNMK